ncbi:MAG: L,D-transpeptidase family protein [Phycisphaerales bacterium]|nr:L,D-transpeptidase family protein [Phycisphaerales bacterium]
MALPSQVERSVEMSRPVMRRPHRRRSNTGAKAIVYGALLLGACGAVYGAYALVTWVRGRDQGTPPSTLLNDPAPSTGRAGMAGTTGMTGMTGAGDAVAKPRTSPPPPVASQLPRDGMPNNAPDATRGTDTPKPLPVDVTRIDLTPRSGQPQPSPGGQPPVLPGAGGDPIGSSGSGAGGGTPGGITPTASTSEVLSLIAAGDKALSEGRAVEARTILSRAYLHPQCTSGDREMLRGKLTHLNDDLVFSARVTPGDPLCETYSVASGDSLVKIAKKRELATDWRLIQRINRISSPRNLSVGQKLKLVRGPFHAVVTKSDYRLDLFAGPPTEPERWVLVRSYRVGLGEKNGTPTGEFVIKKGSKLVNPPWVNPRTGEKFGADDPKNPIGEYWLGWQGVNGSESVTGYGLHGTIDPSSIGEQKSMGCVRLGDDDVAQIYELLVEDISRVRVVP